MTDRTGRIRALNDQLRTSGIGGQLVITCGVASLPEPDIAAVLLAVKTFTDFTPDNDPHEEHDFALIEAAGERVMFKIDYYDRALSMHSPDAADPAVTVRVLTIMFSSEY
jgi:hypothetical protein